MADKTENKQDKKADKKAKLEAKLEQIYKNLNPLSKVFDSDYLAIMPEVSVAINRLHQDKIEVLRELEKLENEGQHGQTRATGNTN